MDHRAPTTPQPPIPARSMHHRNVSPARIGRSRSVHCSMPGWYRRRTFFPEERPCYSLRVSSFTKSEEHELSVECRGSPHRRDQFHNGFGWKVGFHHFEGVQSQCATITVKVRASQWLSVSRSGGG